ncbi:XRE family transcriptional regulator [Micromonospora sp. WMMD882]|uniref:XRE family transcriptional regulator n=1 Tax=Micromonospora sp. WMMD882 TaxID=3015151 RepID=UPI00248C4D83|nr:XRE family transcriptional regulator [Micromonospora sp. WMMD882]WBB82107.1 XRE family transcriptional regulator [Micromonospora sp. WMMD882]
MARTEPSTFGAQLTRLAELRGLDVGALAGRAAAPAAEITSAFDGNEPTASLLRRLAPALGLRPSDLFVIAGRQVPGDLAPLDPTAANAVGWLAWALTYLPHAARELRRLARTMPQQPRPPGPPPPAPPYRWYPDGPGGLLLRLLHNRNLDWSGAAKYLFGIGRRDMLSASTIGMIGHGRKTLTPDLLTGFAAVLDIPATDLSALTGIDLTGPERPVHPDAPEVAALIWDARRLTAHQLRQLQDRAHQIRHERAHELEPRLRCGCPRYA